MAETDILVDGVSGVDAPRTFAAPESPVHPHERFAAVRFHEGRDGFLDMTRPQSAVWAEVFESLRENNQPAYVEIDRETNVITELLIPITVAVVGIEEAEEGEDLSVELAISHARHYVRRSNPDFDKLHETLRIAMEQKNMVIVTESADDSEIIDVRLIEGMDTGGLK